METECWFVLSLSWEPSSKCRHPYPTSGEKFSDILCVIYAVISDLEFGGVSYFLLAITLKVNILIGSWQQSAAVTTISPGWLWASVLFLQVSVDVDTSCSYYWLLDNSDWVSVRFTIRLRHDLDWQCFALIFQCILLKRSYCYDWNFSDWGSHSFP
jgi:hypothetical protein